MMRAYSSVDGSIKVDMTKLFPGSTLQDGVLYDKSGHPIETEGRKWLSI